MIIGVPKEVKLDECRVAMLPVGVEELTRRGHKVLIEHGAGIGSGLLDQEYQAAGAEILNDVVLNQVAVHFGSDAETQATIAKVQADGVCFVGGAIERFGGDRRRVRCGARRCPLHARRSRYRDDARRGLERLDLRLRGAKRDGQATGRPRPRQRADQEHADDER